MMLGTEALATVIEQVGQIRTLESAGLPEFVRLVDASAAMIWMGDNQGLCTFANRSWLEFRGRTLGQELGHGWTEGIHQEDTQTTLRAYWSACNTRRPFRLEYRVLGKDANYHEVERLGLPWPGIDGDPQGYIGSVSVLEQTNQAVREARKQVSLLSTREYQVLQLIASGHSTKQIAGKLGISYKTADSHRTHVLKKLGIHETATLVRFAVRAGVIAA
ncbi:MAG: PAS domain-containing protein [Acidobacteriia bacterium]|nr:PAS domain-containing protein [Terriglobia bacterium]